MNEIPRRAQMQQWTPAERAIYDALQAVEAMPADERLTDAVVLLGAARDSVADFVDGVQQRRFVGVGTAPPHMGDEQRERERADAESELLGIQAQRGLDESVNS